MNKILIIVGILSASCQTRLVPIAKRSMNIKSGELFKKGRKIRQNQPEESTKVFIKKDSLSVSSVKASDNNGSLFYMGNPDNYLFYDRPLGNVGDVIKVLVRTRASEAGESNQDNGKEAEADKLKDELLQALPQFEPSQDNNNLSVLTSIQFKVDKKLPNGDLLVSSFRMSSNDDESNTIIIRGRIAGNTISSKKPLTTNDLHDIELYQKTNSEEFERSSLAWEDEYTLTLSGFDEAKSRYAQQLEDKRGDLKKVSEQLRKRINALRQEKKQFATARRELDQQKSKLGETLKEYDRQIKEYQGKVEEQKSILKKQQEIIDRMEQGGESPGESRGGGDNG